MPHQASIVQVLVILTDTSNPQQHGSVDLCWKKRCVAVSHDGSFPCTSMQLDINENGDTIVGKVKVVVEQEDVGIDVRILRSCGLGWTLKIAATSWCP